MTNISNPRFFDQLNWIYRAAPGYLIFHLLSHLLTTTMMMMIVIMATTKAAGAAEISWVVAAKSPFMQFFLLICVLYSKSEMKFTQPVNQMYENHLCSSLELIFIFLI